MPQNNFSGQWKFIFWSTYSDRTAACTGVSPMILWVFFLENLEHAGPDSEIGSKKPWVLSSDEFFLQGYTKGYTRWVMVKRASPDFEFSSDFHQNTVPTRLEPSWRRSGDVLHSLWSPGEKRNSQNLWTLTITHLRKYFLSWEFFIEIYEISIQTGFGPTEINFQPIPTCEGSISVADTPWDRHQVSQVVGDRQNPAESTKSCQET